jgi:hypothetical protein
MKNSLPLPTAASVTSPTGIFSSARKNSNERIQRFFASLDAHAQRTAEQRTQVHTLAVGDGIYNSWGYDQTNVDFYEVVRTSANFVWLQSLAWDLKDMGFRSDEVTPRAPAR